MSEKIKDVSNRRDFLKLAGMGAVASAAVLTVAGKQAEAGEKAGKGRPLYRETDHVKKFYETAKF